MAEEKGKKERFEELCAAYVLGSLDPEEQQEFEELLRSATQEERQLYEDLRKTGEYLSLGILAQNPSRHIKQDILNRVQTIGSQDTTSNILDNEPEAGRYSWYRWLAAAAAVFLMIAVGMSLYTRHLERELNLKNQTITELTQQVQQKEALLSVLGARDVDVVILNGQQVNPDGYGKIIWDPKGNRAILQVSNLPPVPKDKEYQLWAIKGKKPVSAGVFAVHAVNQPAFFKVSQLAGVSQSSLSAFAITLEPKGGVPQPTGKMYLMGTPAR